MTGTDLVVVGDDSSFLALRMEEDRLGQLIQANLGSGGADSSMLDRIKMPSAGNVHWAIPTVDGEDSNKELSGVILHWGTRRVRWEHGYDDPNREEGAPPICSSEDGFKGQGEPGGDCAACPFNVFGSGKNNSKGCTELRQLFILPDDSIIPMVLNVTPGSLRVMSQYFMRLLRAGISSQGVVTKLTLEKTKNKSGQQYSKIIAAAGDRLSPEAEGKMIDLATKLEPLFTREAMNISQTDVEGSAEED